jgi:hypothetical protein
LIDKLKRSMLSSKQILLRSAMLSVVVLSLLELFAPEWQSGPFGWASWILPAYGGIAIFAAIVLDRRSKDEG